MTIFLYFLIGAILGAGVVWFLERKRTKELEVELERTKKEKEEQLHIVSGIDEFNRRMQEIKEERKQKIIGFLTDKKKIKTNEVADLLDISRATAFRYLEELEKEGKIEQIGAFGRNVQYKLK
ncbi:DeoR family transcriptional regulator [Patescibacteria group bacterium]|nr:DeoR family transcriptional regulator [Patescibacteria group bacterium]